MSLPLSTRIAEYAARVVASAPPLTPAQRDRLAALFSTRGEIVR